MSVHPSGRLVSLLLRVGLSSDRDSEVVVFASSSIPTTGALPDGQKLAASQRAYCLYSGASATEDAIYWTANGGTTWTKLLTLSDLLLPAVTDVTVTAGGVATLTGAAHTIRGAGGLADNLDTISGMTATEVAFLVTGAEAITYRDASTGGGNIAIQRNASLVTATGDLVMVLLSGTTVYVIPLMVQAGVPTSATAPGATDSATTGATVANSTDATGATVANSTDATGVTAAGANTAAGGTGSVTGATASDGTGATGSGGTHTLGILLPMLAPQPWAIDGDGAETNGGGLVGHAAVLTQVGAGECLVYDAGTGEYEPIETAGGTWRAAPASNYAILPDAPANDDALMVMYSIPFPEVAFDVSATVAVYTGVAGKWQVSTGAGTWVDVTTIYDNSSAAVHTGTQPLSRDGALIQIPEATWASATYSGKTGYWLRFVVTDATKITTVAILNNKRAEIVTAEQGWAPPQAVVLESVYFCDSGMTLHTANDVKLLLWNQTTGDSRVATFAQDKRQEIATITSWTVAIASRISTWVVQEDGTNEPQNALLGVYGSITVADHTHTGPAHTHAAGTLAGPSHDHAAGAITVTDAGHSHTATVTDAGHSHTATVTDAGHTHAHATTHTHNT